MFNQTVGSHARPLTQGTAEDFLGMGAGIRAFPSVLPRTQMFLENLSACLSHRGFGMKRRRRMTVFLCLSRSLETGAQERPCHLLKQVLVPSVSFSHTGTRTPYASLNRLLKVSAALTQELHMYVYACGDLPQICFSFLKLQLKRRYPQVGGVLCLPARARLHLLCCVSSQHSHD